MEIPPPRDIDRSRQVGMTVFLILFQGNGFLGSEQRVFSDYFSRYDDFWKYNSKNGKKIVFRLVTAVGDAYGVALLLHMLATTITLTLLAYQATKVI